MWASQTGKTEIVNNAVGYFIHADPSPILMVQPTTEMAEAWSKERLAPTIRDTPVLRPLVKDPRSRDSGNTILIKLFPGGSIAIVGANAPSGLAGRPRRVVMCDEVDRYPMSAGTEGDPVSLAIRRTESFWNSVVILTSTPTIKGMSRIESEFEQTDQRRWFCPCPKCGAMQTMKWGQVVWPKGEPEKAVYVCESCKESLSDSERRHMVLRGEWRATAPFKGKRGYHYSGIGSPFPAKRGFKSRLHQMAAGFLEAKANGNHAMKTWVNTFLAETWVDEGEDIEASPLAKRREDYGGSVPNGVCAITIGADVQNDRIECEVVGWGVGEESWGLYYGRFPGSPETRVPWDRFEELINKTWTRADGVQLKAMCSLVDSGFATKAVYDFVKRMHVRSVFASKGIGGQGKPFVGRFGKASTAKVIMYPIGVDTGKELFHSRLKLSSPGPGYCHFPMEYEEEYFDQITAERRERVYEKGFAKYVWKKIRPRNEALDCRVLAAAALACRNLDLAKMSERVAKAGGSPSLVRDGVDIAAKPDPNAIRRQLRGSMRQSGWVGRWR